MIDRWHPVACLDRVLRDHGLRRCQRVRGGMPPPESWLLSDLPRLVLGLSGRCLMEWPTATIVHSEAFEAGDALLVPARSWNLPRSGDMSFLVLFIDDDHIRLRVWHQEQVRARRGDMREAMAGMTRPTLRLLLRAALGLADDDEESLRVCCELMMRQAARLLAADDEVPSAACRLWRQVKAWLDHHLGEEIDRTMVCARFGIHPNHLTRVFSEQGGEGFTSYLIRKRMERAAYLLREHELSVAEVGRLCGYPRPAAFSTAVRKWHGRSPRELRFG